MSPTREGLARIAWRSLVGYALYAVAVLAVFLVVSFPYDRLQVAMVEALARQTHSRITVDDGRFVLPLGLRWRGVRIEPPSGDDRALLVDALRVRVALLPLVRRTVDADLAWEAYGGRVRGSWVARREPDGVRSALDQFGQGFDLARLPRLPAGEWRGTVGFEVSGRWTNGAWWMGEGTGSAEVAGLRVNGLTVAGFPVNGIEFDTMTAQVALKGGTVTLQRLMARGALGTASGDGTVLVRSPWTESLINVTLTLAPAQGAASRMPLLALAGTTGGPITVQIKGRLAKPAVTLNGTPLS
ncbi:MAG: type II secretion system protein GspN [Nitrospirae bacterium]|nr:type II secretion system protein GspN [Nitrospirota bacterium]